ncbi:7282_t:CDS:2 [Scutellospora calospora]|uniref:7282_t:CDS:1 n=1 Tax=Scutellospora calospora TaxID=85575 RepID=A0ACA9KQI7_9GLOM|nr:7282_t:CDS:2 [Scutellospora calospora]
MSAPVSPQKKRRLSTSPVDDRRTNVNESLKKVKPENPTGSSLSIPTAQTSTSNKGKASSNAQTQSTPSSTQQSQQIQHPINDSTQDLLVRLTKKEEEIQSLLGELQNLSQTLTPDFTFDQSLRKKFLDPAINLLFRTMKKELEDKDKTIEFLQNELDGVGFTPNRLELGRQLRQGRVEQYEVEIALQRKMIYELKHSLEESDNQLISMDNEMERLQDYVFKLRAKVKLYEDKFGSLDNNSSVDISKSDVNMDTESTKVEQKLDI